MSSPTGPTLVVLAGGLGTRFGGPKQLAEVGEEGAAIMDILVRRSAAAGFARAVIVVAPTMEAQIAAHLGAMPAAGIPVALAVQRLVPGRSGPLGTADAALAVRALVEGDCVVVNGDDLYPADGFEQLAAHLRDAPAREHALAGFRVGRTLTGNRPVSRALISESDAGTLVSIKEGTVTRTERGLQFEAGGAVLPLPAEQCVSMNMWAFRPSVFGALATAVDAFIADDRDGEVYLPDVVAAMVGAGETVRVLISEHACVGVTHDEDVAAVRDALR